MRAYRTITPAPKIPVASASPSSDVPDRLWEARRLLQAFAETLCGAIECRRLCRAAVEPRRRRSQRWGEPSLFFFNGPAVTTPATETADWLAYLPEVRARNARSAVAWDRLATEARTVRDLLMASVEVRRIARIVPDLYDRLSELADVLPILRDLLELIDLIDDEVLVVLFPEANAAWRVRVRGVVDIAQLHVLLTDALADELFGLPGGRPSPELVAAYRDPCEKTTELLVESRFEFSDGRVLRCAQGDNRFGDLNYRLWDEMRLRDIPVMAGCRVIVLSVSESPRRRLVERRFLGLRAETSIVEPLPSDEVARWLANYSSLTPVK